MENELKKLTKHLQKTEQYFVELSKAINKSKRTDRSGLAKLQRRLYATEDQVNKIIKQLDRLKVDIETN